MSSISATTGPVNADGIRQAVELLINEPGSANMRDRREEQRHPFFRPVTLTLASGDRFEGAFCLDISWEGICFVHNTPLQPGDVTVNICSHSGDPVRLRTQIEWCECQPWGKGWYISGGRFLDVVGTESI